MNIGVKESDVGWYLLDVVEMNRDKERQGSKVFQEMIRRL